MPARNSQSMTEVLASSGVSTARVSQFMIEVLADINSAPVGKIDLGRANFVRLPADMKGDDKYK